MNSHIAIEIGGNAITLPEGQTIDIEEQNPTFNDVEMHSYPVELPFDYNRAVFKNIDARDSSLRAVDVENASARIIVDGLPFRSSVLHVQEDETLIKSIPVNFDSRTKSFKDMIADMRCRDVPVDDDILIGEKIGSVKTTFRYFMRYRFICNDSINLKAELDDYDYTTISGESFEPPVIGFSYPGHCASKSVAEPLIAKIKDTKTFSNDVTINIPEVTESYINVSKPYPQAKYCNSRVCYTHYDITYEESNGNKTPKVENGSYVTSKDVVPSDNANYSINEDRSPYWVLPADRPGSGICFYVGYFLERLFKHLGVAYDMKALTDIEDFNYMAMFNTACKFDTKTQRFMALSSLSAINEWLSSRGCGGQLGFSTDEKDSSGSGEWEVSEASLLAFNMRTGKYQRLHYKIGDEFDFSVVGGTYSGGEGAKIKKIFVKPVIDTANGNATAQVEFMYANSDNFPDVSVSEVIESLESAFGVRFYYDAEINKVTVYLLRDVFCSSKTPIHLNAHVNTMYKMTEKITGVRVRYSAESDVDEQYRNIRYGVRDYDTNYDYVDYPPGRTIVDKTYKEIAKKVDSGDMNVYVIQATGNAIRTKVDSDASTVKDLKPVQFEVGQFKGVDIGDCSKRAEDEDTIKEITIGFQPLVVNDVNFRNGGTTNPDYQPILVPYVDVDMEHEFVETRLQNIITTEYADVYFNYILKHYEAYDPSSTDDGQSPLQSYDWGLTLGILRTGDGGAGVENYDPNYDGFGNYRWRDVADNYCMSSDTMDQTGLWLGKTDQANTFSLKIRAYKPFRYKKDPDNEGMFLFTQNPAEWENDTTWLIPCDDDVRNSDGQITRRVRSRGLVDTFLAEYIYFLLNRQKYKVTAMIEIAQLADIPNHWRDRYEIDGKIGYIDKLHYSIDAEKGIGEVEIEFFAIS